MLNALCASSSFNVADIVVLVILGLGVLSGLISGFAKMLNGALGTILAILISIIAAIFLADMLAGVSFMSNLADTIDTKMVDWATGLGSDAKVEDSIIYLSSGGEWKAITDVYTEGLPAKLVGIAQPVIVKLLGGALNGSTSIAAATSALTVKILSGVIIAVVGIIVIEIVFMLLARLFHALATKQKPIKTIDRLLGIVFSAVISVLIIFVVFFVVYKLGDKAAGFMDTISSSTVAKWFFENNPFLLLIK